MEKKQEKNICDVHNFVQFYWWNVLKTNNRFGNSPGTEEAGALILTSE